MLNKALPFVHRFIELILKKGIDLKQVILYGSFLDRSASSESDVDLKIIVKYKSDKEKILKIESEINKEITEEGFRFYISSDVSTKVSLEHIQEGILLWGNPVLMSTKKQNLLKKHIITYSTDNLKQVKRAELSRRLLGYKISGKYSFTGILGETGSKRLRNAIICDGSSEILKILKSYEKIEVEDSILYMNEYAKFVEKKR